MTTIIKLAPILDLTTVEGLRNQLLDGFAQGDTVEIDAAELQRVTSPGLQVLAAAVQRGASIADPPSILREIAQLLDLKAALGFGKDSDA